MNLGKKRPNTGLDFKPPEFHHFRHDGDTGHFHDRLSAPKFAGAALHSTFATSEVFNSHFNRAGHSAANAPGT
jgi:hypothetical protein